MNLVLSYESKDYSSRLYRGGDVENGYIDNYTPILFALLRDHSINVSLKSVLHKEN